MNPGDFTRGDMFAPRAILLIVGGTGFGIGRLLEYFRNREQR